jgi:glycosyltransferase involved in cell wall biosynthesis
VKPIKIFAMPSHAAKERTSGVDFARIIQPMGALSKHKDFKVTIYDPNLNEKMDWLEVVKENDILFLNYTTNPWSFAIMGCLARKHGRVIVLDMDDALWDVLPDNTAFEHYKEGSEGIKNFTAICNEVDYVTCTNRYLRNVIVNRSLKTHDRIAIFPNYIDFKLYNHRSPFKDTNQIQLTHFGSSSHFKSLQSEEFAKGIDMIFKEYPNITFKTVGAAVPKYKNRWGQRYSHGFGDTDVYKWIKDKFPSFMDETDIIVAPLTVNLYNRSKSSIKFIEASSAKKPGVWQKIRQYEEIVEDGKNGFVANWAKEWHSAIKKLIDDKELRRRVGEKAFKTTKEDWQMKNHVEDYASFFKLILDKGGK